MVFFKTIFPSSLPIIGLRLYSRGMLGQKKISSFFTTVPPKRASSSDSSSKIENPEKKRKLDTSAKTLELAEGDKVKGALPVSSAPSTEKPDDIQTPHTPEKEAPKSPDAGPSEGSPVPAATPLTPEQKAVITENQLSAKLKLTTKNTNGLVRDFGLTWFKALQAEFTKPYFLQLANFVESERQKATVYPPPDQVFTFTRMSEIKEVKVIIIGQDPYHGPRQAHGLSFSVQKSIKSPPSLENMYKELATDIEGFKHPGHGNLSGWAEQGVMMLNACLTVRAHQANSHQGKGWEKFTDAIISWFNKNRPALVFILWGAYAQKKGAQIDKKKHCVLKGVHPSPLSAHRGYFGCKHFSQCNKYLKEHSKTPIDWTHLPEC